MASYPEIRGLFSNSNLVERTEVALIIAAEGLLTGVTPTAAEKAWSAGVLGDPSEEAKKGLKFILAANDGLSVAAITGATDAALQANIDTAVPLLVDAMAGV